MRMVELDLHPDRSRLRQFGLVALVFFGLLGGLALWRGSLVGIGLGSHREHVAIVLWAVGALSAVLGLMWPAANRPLYVGLMLVAFPIGTVLSYVLMAVLFYIVITPVGLWFRVIRRDALHRRFEPDAPSYWVEHRPVRRLERYFQQF